MILIRSIDFIEVRNTVAEIYNQHPKHLIPVYHEGEETMKEVSIVAELIKGRRYCRPSDGLDIYVGVSRQAQDALGIQYEAFEALKKHLEITNTSLNESNKKIEEARSASLWTRMKWLFNGYR